MTLFQSPRKVPKHENQPLSRPVYYTRSVTEPHYVTSKILALRQQLAMVKQKSPKRLRFHRREGFFWVWLYRLWPDCLNALHVFKPDTLVRWHRKGFRLFWTKKCKGRAESLPKFAFHGYLAVLDVCDALHNQQSKSNAEYGKDRGFGYGHNLRRSKIKNYNLLMVLRRCVLTPCCPAGVNIPSCFECYNSKHAFKDKAAKMMYLFQNGGIVTDKPTLASMCVECGQCLEKCPQNLPIPDLLKEVQEDMEGFMAKSMVWMGKRVMKVRKKSRSKGQADSVLENKEARKRKKHLNFQFRKT